jgi:ethanolamine utilization protein EutQ (cupin superfamily)
MMTAMAGLEAKSFSSPDETRPFQGKGKMDVVKVGGMTVGKGVFEPGWRWSVNVKPLAGTDSCQGLHVGYMLSGRMHVRMDDGTEAEAGPGDVVHIEPGHDAWIVGDEPCVFLDFGTTVAQYAKRA